MTKWDKDNLLEKREDISQLYLKHRMQLYQFIVSSTQDKELAKDIVQETFLEALRQYDTFRQHPQKIGWLYKTARNKIHEIQRKFQQIDWACIGIDSEEICEPEIGYMMKEMELTLRKELTSEEFERFYRYFIWGYSIKEMAEMEGITENNIYVKLSRLRKKLK